MSFERISFAHLFHEAFELEADRLLAHMLFLNEVRRYAEATLLGQLAETAQRPALPPVPEEEVQARFEDFQYEIDYMEPDRIELLLNVHGVALDELGGALYRDMRVERLVDAKIAAAQTDPASREALLWQMFVKKSLRVHLVRAAGVEQMARSRAAADPGAIARAREHARCRHGLSTWTAVEQRLLERWQMRPETLATVTDLYARAMG